MRILPLFPGLGGDEPTERPPVDRGLAPPPRLRRPDREQMLMRPCSLDELLGDDHDARLVWRLVETWDLAPLLDKIRARGELIDGGYVKLDEVDRAAAAEPPVTLYMPVPKPRKAGTGPHEPKKTEVEAVARWRQRMGTAEAKASYKGRAATIETVNAELKSERGLVPFRVRGLCKVRCVSLWCALAYNVMHFGWQVLSLAT